MLLIFLLNQIFLDLKLKILFIMLRKQTIKKDFGLNVFHKFKINLQTQTNKLNL
jgi:hypothetical protein